jgi:heptosyltransferase III
MNSNAPVMPAQAGIQSNNKILIVMPDKHLGNFVISLNAIIPLRNYYGEDNVAIIFDETHRDMVADNVGIKNIFFYPRKKLGSTKSLLQRANIYLKFIYEIRKFNPTISAALESCNVSALMSFLSGASRRIGLDENKLPLLLNEKILFRKNVHRLESYFDITEQLGLSRSQPFIKLTTSQQNPTFVKDTLIKHGMSLEKPLLCIHTGAAKLYKQWPLENFLALIAILAKEAKYEIILIGGPAEYAQNEKLIQQSPYKLYNLAGYFSVNQLTALFQQTKLFICNDSGPMHVAALSGTSLIALFGPTEEHLWGPLSTKATLVLGGTKCANNCKEKFREPFARCFCELTVEKVVSAVN